MRWLPVGHGGRGRTPPWHGHGAASPSRRLAATAGAVRSEAPAERLGWSRRHLVRRFREQTAPSPKTAAQLFRFEPATALMRATALLRHRPPVRPPTPPLAALATEAGYADQAHFGREVPFVQTFARRSRT
ncbi:hypothetical protein ADL21_29175 [Streptomyces albus subsp. albus]|nr:hypothetical protein ADL21_29175 [Streptomyces albus subsp. albus]